MPSSNVDDTVKCRHSLPCRHQMWMTQSSADTVKCRHSLPCHQQMHMTPSSVDTACHAIIKCGWHRQGQTQLAVPSSNVDDTGKCRQSACHAFNVEPFITSRVTSTAATHTYVKPSQHSARDSKNTNLDKPTGVGDHCRATGQYWPVNPTAGTREKSRRLHISNREHLPWTETRDTICLPFTTKLSRRNLSQHTWHLYVNKARSWRVETSCTSSTIMLQSKLTYTTICLSVCHITWRTVRWLFHPAHFSNMKHAQWPSITKSATAYLDVCCMTIWETTILYCIITRSTQCKLFLKLPCRVEHKVKNVDNSYTNIHHCL